MGEGGEDDAALVKLMEVATLCTVPMALKAAIRLKVMDILAQQGAHDGGQHFLSAAQIARHLDPPIPATSSLPTAIASLDRILRLLAGHGLLASSLSLDDPLGLPSNSYALNSTSRFLVHSPNGSFAPYVSLIQDPIMMQCFYDLHEAVLDTTSSPFSKIHGTKCFSYTQLDPRFDDVFNKGMVGHTKLFMHSFLRTYHGFGDVNSLVDVGGGSGICLGMITSQHPHIEGINFDQRHVITSALEYPGVEHVGGDMFESIPKGDAIFMKWILHDWSDAHCLKILENCYRALPDKGKVIIVDVLLPDGVETSPEVRVGYHTDLLMLAFNEGGKERTARELERLAQAAGFTSMKSICKVDINVVIELYKN
ncbi:hypothetical protein GOP47_0001994 [Adiantum capillus-veneris]|uniref:Uncharacterized protein n=1 Tax=Adiantum capillus-veneris TaxID=13818 RepID=A0A9D4VAN2_ADICA|nr:hypothetical protein GOP47_0001994 [Adiantum capillus-veneris]